MTVGELAKHGHDIITAMSSGNVTLDSHWKVSVANVTNNTVDDDGGTGYRTAGTLFSGNSEYHNNVSPCIAVYAWRRIA